jgi:acetoin utilization deacetylase AcuC-like enzyme
VRFVVGRRYGLELPSSSHDARRSGRILSYLLAEGLVSRRDVQAPRPVSMRALRRVHDDAYLESLQETSSLMPILGYTLPEEQHDEFLYSYREIVGGTVQASRLALANRGVVVNLGGGFHHARSDRGQGFCVFNDVAVAVAKQREQGFRDPVLVIDLDLHDGDGTREIFANDPSVHTFSIHNRHLGPVEAQASTSIELGSGVGDELYLRTLRERLPDLLRAVRPGMVFYLAGCDPADDDALGDWRISAKALLERDRLVMEQIRGASGPVPTVVLLAGGYGQEAWRYSARFFAALLGHPEPEPPPTSQLALAHFRRISSMLRTSELTAEPADAELSLTEDDLLPTSYSSAKSTRFLEYYSLHGVELALERYGVFDRLRKKGYDDLTLEFELDDPSGQSLRVRTRGNRSESLAELKVRRERRLFAGLELLAVEWLLLQDPRAVANRGRVALPGQEHPGLGMLREVSALLILICERLGLDGLLIVPSHYHIAALTTGHCRFVDPTDEARFEALREALAGTRLAEASRAIEEGRVVDRESGEPFRWKPAPMVLPFSDRLKAALEARRSAAEAPPRGKALAYRLLAAEDRGVVDSDLR